MLFEDIIWISLSEEIQLYFDIVQYFWILGDPWRCLKMSENVWRYLENSGDVCKCLDISEDLWDHFEICEEVSRWKIFGGSLELQEIFGELYE